MSWLKLLFQFYHVTLEMSYIYHCVYICQIRIVLFIPEANFYTQEELLLITFKWFHIQNNRLSSVLM